MKTSLRFTLLVLAGMSFNAQAALTPEQETLAISKQLSPISDDRWSEIAGKKVTEKYDITQGDTLYDISNRLFGDSKYWPKIWALNNSGITNPHVIKPGNQIAFNTGTGSSLPGVQLVEGNESGLEVLRAAAKSGRSTEWARLPHQNWESTNAKPSEQIDRLGFDRRSKISFNAPKGFELPAIIATDRLTFLGEVASSKETSEYLGLQNEIYIRSNGESLQVNQIYAVTRESNILKKAADKNDKDAGITYRLLGRVLITGTLDGYVVGRIVESQLNIIRGDQLIPNQPLVAENLEPVPGPSSLSATIMTDYNLSVSNSVVQFREAFVDRGSDDGITLGMIFRVYDHKDLENDKTITAANDIPGADFMVVQVSSRFSSVIALSTPLPVQGGTPAVLLTDISTLKKSAHRILEKAPEAMPTPKASPEVSHLPTTSPSAVPSPSGLPEVVPVPTPTDTSDLDKLDQGGKLTPEQEKELEQLEKAKQNSEISTPPTAPEAPVPTPNLEPAPAPTVTTPAKPPAELSPPSSDDAPPPPLEGIPPAPANGGVDIPSPLGIAPPVPQATTAPSAPVSSDAIPAIPPPSE